MMRMPVSFVAALMCLATPILAQQDAPMDKPVRETTEWLILRWEQAPDITLPRLLLIGDSIANGYAADTTKLLKGRANVDLLATSKSIADPAFLREVEMATADYDHAVIHFNNGLHGWHLTDAQYEAGLRALVAKLRELEPGAKLIWAHSTTAVIMPGGELDPAKNARVIARNQVAIRVMAELGVPVNDLYAFVMDHGDWHSDPLHFKPEARALMAETVVKAVQPSLIPEP